MWCVELRVVGCIELRVRVVGTVADGDGMEGQAENCTSRSENAELTTAPQDRYPILKSHGWKHGFRTSPP